MLSGHQFVAFSFCWKSYTWQGYCSYHLTSPPPNQAQTIAALDSQLYLVL